MVVYKVTNLVNGKIYVGKDSKNKPSYYGGGVLIGKAIKKYGKEAFRKETIEQCASQEEMNEKELYWIIKLNTLVPKGYNITLGGGGFKGKHTKRTKEGLSKKLSEWWKDPEKRKMQSERLKGRKLSEEHKRKISEGGKGKHQTPLSEEHKRKIGEAHKGRVFSKEHKRKLSEAKKEENHPLYGKHRSEEVKRKISLNNYHRKLSELDICAIRKLIEENNLTQKQIGKQFGIDQGQISRIKNRKAWSCVR